jgi:hypothetical protein
MRFHWLPDAVSIWLPKFERTLPIDTFDFSREGGKMLNLIFICILSALSSSAPDIPEEKYLTKAATELGVDFSELRIDRQDLEFYGSERFRVELFDILIYQPHRVLPFTRALARPVLENADSLWALAYFPWARINEGVRRGLIQRNDVSYMDSLRSLPDIKSILSAQLRRQYGADKFNLDPFPDTLALGLVFLLSEIINSLEWLRSANLSNSENDIDSMVNLLCASGDVGLSNPDIERMIANTDFKALSAGFMELSYFVQTAIPVFKNCRFGSKFEVSTTYGKVVLGTINDDQYENSTYLLIIDPSGNDKYRSCGRSGHDNPVSIVIDFEGDDDYGGEIGPGTGIAGYGIVVDLSGNDSYRAARMGVGTGIFGAGMILDREGNDEYTTDLYGEGAGLFGTGVVSDLSGDDRYTGFQGCQGFGFVKGCGLLVDREGNDTYVARDDTVKYASSQTKEHNVSLSQGAGFGVRADFTDGHSLAGGVGMLVDGNGDDRYSCGVFGQGCGYWYGLGFLVDYEGNDAYDGIWYVQGAGAHFAVGVLMDSTGSDTFRATMNMAQGAGHDFTLGVLCDYEGSDHHDVPNLSLGSGNANGMGLFIDHSGDDEYMTRGGITLGRASTDSRGGLRDYMRTIGVFIDGGGRDRYSAPIGSNNDIWVQEPPLEPRLRFEWCIGIDF